MQYYSSAVLMNGNNLEKDGPFVKVTALANSDVKIESSVIEGSIVGGSAVTFTMKANTTIDGVHINKVTLDSGTVIAYRA